MARKMWGNDSRYAYRAVVTVTYPEGWSIYGMPVGEWVETTHHGPYLHPGAAKAAVTMQKRQIMQRWRAQVKRNPELPIPTIEHAIESSELRWVTTSD